MYESEADLIINRFVRYRPTHANNLEFLEFVDNLFFKMIEGEGFLFREPKRILPDKNLEKILTTLNEKVNLNLFNSRGRFGLTKEDTLARCVFSESWRHKR